MPDRPARPVGFPCRKCKRPVCTAVCPRCLHDNRDWIATIKRMYERATSLDRGLSSEFGTAAPKEVSPKKPDKRPHWRDRMRWNEHDRCSDRGIIPPVLPIIEGKEFQPEIKIIHNDAETALKKLKAKSINCCVTSPPYFQLRTYGVDNDLGLMPTIEAYIAAMVAVFREVWRVLTDDGLLFLEIGDSYAGSGCPANEKRPKLECCRKPGAVAGVQRKSKCAIPEELVVALRRTAWIYRQVIVVEKTNFKPEPKNMDRPPTSDSPFVYMLAKSENYYYKPLLDERGVPVPNHWRIYNGDNLGVGRHPAPMLLPVAKNCIAMGCPVGGTALDPFCGSAQVGVAAIEHGCHFVGIDASLEYINTICIPRLVKRESRKATRG